MKHMILVTSGFVPLFPTHAKKENIQRRAFHCRGFSKPNQAYSSESKEANRTSHHRNRRSDGYHPFQCVCNLAHHVLASSEVICSWCECFDLYKELVPYKEAWHWQKTILRRRHALIDRDEDHSDMLIILQHHPVYTLGTGSLEEHLKFDMENAPYNVYRTERGGEVTYHGPGQIVMYPVLNLRYHKMDLHWYLRSLEEIVIRLLSSTFSIKASRLEGFTGVWVGNQKVAAIGIRVSRWITYHGLALNVTTDLTPFQHIVPCGIRDRQVGSISGLLGQSSNGWTPTDANLMNITHESLLKEFSEVFQLSLEHKLVSDLNFLEENS